MNTVSEVTFKDDYLLITIFEILPILFFTLYTYWNINKIVYSSHFLDNEKIPYQLKSSEVGENQGKQNTYMFNKLPHALLMK